MSANTLIKNANAALEKLNTSLQTTKANAENAKAKVEAAAAAAANTGSVTTPIIEGANRAAEQAAGVAGAAATLAQVANSAAARSGSAPGGERVNAASNNNPLTPVSTNLFTTNIPKGSAAVVTSGPSGNQGGQERRNIMQEAADALPGSIAAKPETKGGARRRGRRSRKHRKATRKQRKHRKATRKH